MGIRHLCRADFLLDDDNRAWFLEVNTMPGFTGHSLVPMAAAHIGLEMPRRCAHLVDRATGATP
jgi:D-alanine-D-alanine ligase